MITGCRGGGPAGNAGSGAQTSLANPRAAVDSANSEFLKQKSFDPWILANDDPASEIPAYLADGRSGSTYDHTGKPLTTIFAGKYAGGAIVAQGSGKIAPVPAEGYKQTLDMKTGTLTTAANGATSTVRLPGIDWPSLWTSADIGIAGDPEAQQAVHANLFYLVSSIAPQTANSIPPMGLSSTIYAGHIFWDAEVWMLPALLPQFPDRAKSMIDYRFKLLGQAEKNAAAHGYKGAEYPWESADTGKEEAPAEFAGERHITADVAYAAWQYYLWSGDKKYLAAEGWPILQANARYWISRASKGSDGKYHIRNVLSPDETSGEVDDDAWTNGVVGYTLRAAGDAAQITGAAADPQWSKVASELALAFDKTRKIYRENAAANDRLVAKQADTQMLIYPLDVDMPPDVAANTLDYCLAHTMTVGPAMTSSINATIAARLGRAQQSLDLFRDSYRPFMRSGLAAFSEKRTANREYFCTGMGGCLQSVLYGFGGLNVASGGAPGKGKLAARSGDAALYVDPHLPPGWTGLTLKGVHFRSGIYTIGIGAGGSVAVTKGS